MSGSVIAHARRMKFGNMQRSGHFEVFNNEQTNSCRGTHETEWPFCEECTVVGSERDRGGGQGLLEPRGYFTAGGNRVSTIEGPSKIHRAV